MSMHPKIAVIGGSGLYQIPGLENVEEHNINTPFGDPSSPIFVGTLEGQRVAFLARHGIGHTLSPTEVNYRANIFALKILGVENIISVSACGSLRQDYAPGNIVVPDQLFDFTKDRKRSFFEEGMVAHVSVADSFCPRFSDQLYEAVQKTPAKHHRGGTFVTIEGPRFSTKGESNIFRNWGLDLIGMTTSPEAFLAREAEICYAVFAHVTDYDVWHTSEEEVTVEMVIKTVKQNTEIAYATLRHLLVDFDSQRDCNCPTALKSAIMTDQAKIPAQTREKLGLLVDKYLS